MVVAVLLLAAACSNGSDDAGRGAVPTTAPAVTATSATDAVAPATTRTTANVTDVPDDSTTPVATVTVTDTTPTGTTTPVTVGDTTPPVTGTTEPVTSTTGSGPTVPTTLPTTDDTVGDSTDDTTGDNTGDDTDTGSRNAVDDQYPLGSDARKAYLAASGGVAPVGATVTLDMGGKHRDSQHGRTTADRWPNGYPAAPGSPNYQTTTFAQRDAQRQARWVAAMDRSGVGGFDPYVVQTFNSAGDLVAEETVRATEGRYWLRGVPDEIDSIVNSKYAATWGPEPAEVTELRKYQDGGELADQKPPAEVIWSSTRWYLCGHVAHVQNHHSPHNGVFTLPCEAVLDWTIWAVEQVTAPELVDRSDATKAQALWERAFTVIGRALPVQMTTFDGLADAFYGGDSRVVRDRITSSLDWWTLADRGASKGAQRNLWRAWEADLKAGRTPRELVP